MLGRFDLFLVDLFLDIVLSIFHPFLQFRNLKTREEKCIITTTSLEKHKKKNLPWFATASPPQSNIFFLGNTDFEFISFPFFSFFLPSFLPPQYLPFNRNKESRLLNLLRSDRMNDNPYAPFTQWQKCSFPSPFSFPFLSFPLLSLFFSLLFHNNHL